MPRHHAAIKRAFHALVNQSFIGGVLVDNYQTVGGLSNNLGFMKLSARHGQLLMLDRFR